MKKLLLSFVLLLSLSTFAQVQQDTKSNSTFQIFYMGYSNYIVGGYYGQLTNYTEAEITVLIEYAEGSVTVDIPAFTVVAFTLPAERYTINSRIKATCITSHDVPLVIKVRGSYY